MKTKNICFRSLLVLFGMVFSLLSLSKAMAADLLPPQSAIEDASEQMKVKLQSDEFKDDFAQVTEYVEQIIYPHVDFQRISALVLGKHWKKADKAQKEQFKEEFQTLLIRTYARAFIEFNDWNVRYLPLTLKDGAKKTLVKTEVLQPGKQPIAVNYRMALSGGAWKVYDIVIEGVSLVTNYRTSFKNEVKRTGSLDSVIAKMSERNKQALGQEEEKS